MSKEPLPNKELFKMTTLEDLNCRDGVYTGEDDDDQADVEPFPRRGLGTEDDLVEFQL